MAQDITPYEVREYQRAINAWLGNHHLHDLLPHLSVDSQLGPKSKAVGLRAAWYFGVGHPWISNANKGFTRAQAKSLTDWFRHPSHFYRTHVWAIALGKYRIAAERRVRSKITTRQKIARIAEQHLGESQGPFVLDPGEWCADYVNWVWDQAGVRGYYVSALAAGYMEWAKEHGLFHTTPQVGDRIHYGRLHVGIVVQIRGDYVRTVEGNYDDRVFTRWVPKSINGAWVRPTYVVGYSSPPGANLR